MIEPTVGRVVWYRPNDEERSHFAHPGLDAPQPLAAMVVYVHDERSVNLIVFSPRGAPIARSSVPLVQEGDTAPADASFCEWMPYQIGQAKKHESEKTA